MAELVLTKEEEAAPSYLDWSDEALANAVRSLAANTKNKLGDKSLMAVAAANVLIRISHEADSMETTITQEACTSKDEEIGEWVVTVKRKG